MLQCPKCGGMTSDLLFTGWVVKVSGTARIDTRGRITQVGPVKATCTIKQGHELEGLHTEVVCPQCNFSAHIKEFNFIMPCVLTGKAANARFSTRYGDLHIDQSLLDQARTIFTEEALLALEPFRQEMLT